MGDERLARPGTVDRSAQGRPAAGRRRPKRRAISTRNGAVPAARRRATCRRSWRRSPSKDARSKRCGCWRWPTFSIRSTKSRAAIRRAAGSFPLLEAASGGAASFKGETAQMREKIDPSGDVVDHASPELKMIRERLRKQRTPPARHARVVPARQGHGEVPAGSGRHRAQRPLRARRQGRAPQRDSRHRARRRRRAAPACFSSRSAPSKSTTTSSRWRSRSTKRSGASCWR